MLSYTRLPNEAGSTSASRGYTVSTRYNSGRYCADRQPCYWRHRSSSDCQL